MTASIKHEIRKAAKKQFNIPKSAWINVFPLNDKQYEISYLIDRIERKETMSFG